ncbi:hypothetical protein CEUSTIGMA_g1442.t1 [Chlamydomonas eustigma]|uniref:non-specific serine/threonine protein kinase n=1 Tax=Chlamydomonas eustigma TaxID=1157962 RepID=A0A250WTN3_9CHLO|nr:hypothetical protein CEUSTIGMA_g1442.t1 [Chlamydomonas eustigma]|eukprot:GAX73992.1 hypothetical protein CEUSTIGMA_g1442.t1 [Chlamydomonas eustigma]
MERGSRLSDRYMIGEELGRGAYGQVFKGIDSTTGSTVAIKQISLNGTSQDNLQSVMGEIELLKTLNHKNIVKYQGSFKTRTHLYIILEFMENGSLSSIIKQCGVLNEELAAVYIAQVLQGLSYLHEQGVVHRDIKGANILTTKEGIVKLADFGVAAKLGELEERRDEIQQHVVGTPYWMAPEVIEMTQVTSASDIWSVGCLIVEVLNGSPPYFELQPMSALFRIVQDDHPPLPDKISPLMEDFLLLCFQKDPSLRPSASDLLQHQWIFENRKTLKKSWRGGQSGYLTQGKQGSGNTEAHESINSVINRMLAADDDSSVGVAGRGGVEGESLSPRLPGFPNAYNSSVSPLRDAVVSASTAAEAAALANSPSGSVPLPPLPEQQPADVRASGAQGVHLHSSPNNQLVISGSGGTSEGSAQLRDVISSLQGGSQQNGGSGPKHNVLFGLGHRDQEKVLLLDESQVIVDVSASQRLNVMENGGGGSNYLFRAARGAVGLDEERLNEQSREAKVKVLDIMAAMRPTNLGTRESQVPGAAAGVQPAGRYGAPHSACAVMEELIALQPEAQAHFLGEGGVLVLLELLDSDTEKHAEGALDLIASLTRGDARLLRSLCLVGAVPAVCRFTAQTWSTHLRAKAAAFVQRLCLEGDDTLRMFIACQGLKYLVGLVGEIPHSPYSSTNHPSSVQNATAFSQALQEGSSLTHVGLACIWRVLDAYSLLPLNSMCRLLAQGGLIPRLFQVLKQAIATAKLPYASSQLTRKTSQHLSPFANTTPHKIVPFHTKASSNSNPLGSKHTRSPSLPGPASPHQMLHSPTGTATAAMTLDYRGLNKSTSSGSQRASVDGAASIHSKQVAEPSHAAAAAAPGGAAVDPLQWLLQEVVNLLLVMSQADLVVKSFVCHKENLQQCLDCLVRIQPPHLLKLMKAVRWLTGEHAVVPAIKDAGAISTLVPFLAKEKADQEVVLGSEVQLEALHALYNICNLNKKVHLEAASASGITPHLCRFVRESAVPSPSADAPHTVHKAVQSRMEQWPRFRGFVVPMLVGLVACSSSTRGKLWSTEGVEVLLLLLREQDTSVQTGVLQALDTWLSEDHTRVEGKLTQRDAVIALVDLFARSHQSHETQAIPQLLDTLRQMIGRSSKLAVQLAVGGLVPWLLAMIEAAAPIIRVKLLEIIRCLYEHYPRPKEFIAMYNIPDVLRRLLDIHGRGSDAVHSACHQLLTAFQINVLL